MLDPLTGRLAARPLPDAAAQSSAWTSAIGPAIRAASFVRGAAALTGLLGMMVLIGWAVDAPALRSVLPGAVQMKVNTALGLLAAALSLGLATARGERPVARSIARVLAIGVAALGLVTLAQSLGSIDFGIDELLARDTADAFNAVKGRMSPYSAVAFAALGVALAALPHAGAAAGVRTLAGLVAGIGALSLLGYLWNAREIITDRFVPPVAIHTALGLLLLGAGTWLAGTRRAHTPEGERARSRSSIETKVISGFVPVVVLVVVGGGYTYDSGARYAAAADRVALSQEVRAVIGRHYASISDAESAQRNHVLIGKPVYEQAFRTHVVEARRRAQLLGALLRGDAGQLRLFDELHALAEDRIAKLEAVDAEFVAHGEQAARAIIETEEGVQLMQEISRLGQAMDEAEGALVAARDATAQAQRRTTLISLLATLLALTAIFVVLFRSIRREMLARAASESALSASERHNRTLIESSEDCLQVLSLDGRLLDQASKGRAIGTGAAAAAGDDWAASWLTVDDRAAAGAAIAGACAGRTARFRGRAVASDGALAWWDVIVSPIDDADGRPRSLLAVARDVTAQVDAEAAVHRLNESLERRVAERTGELSFQRAFLRRVIDLNRSFVFAKDHEGRFVLANEATAEAYGTTVEALLGKTFAELGLDAEAAPRYAAIDREVIEHGREIVVDEDRLVDASGRLRWFHTVKRPLVTPDGSATLLLGVCTEITARKAAEDAVRQLSADLERRVEERTRDLQDTNLALQQARAQAEQANRAKSAFLATMSHEIRTPMNGVIGMVDVLAQTRLDERQRDAVQTIRGSSFALLGLIDDVLDFSKIEAGRLELERVPLHVAELVEGLCRSLAPVAAGKGVHLRVFVDPRLPARIWSDPIRLRQVLTNLVGNAIKFSGDRAGVPGTVAVRALPGAQAQGWMLQVIDDGIGMSGATLGALFTPFTQAESSTTRRFGGSGLGLAIAHRLVTLMAGSIAVESAPGRGSVFTVSLPLDALADEPPAPLPDLTGIDAVMVESAEVDGADLGAYLRQAGAIPHRAVDAAAAVAIARRLRLAVVIVQQDRQPGAAPLAPALAQAADLPRVMLTARADEPAERLGGHAVAIDGNGLGRDPLLRAVALAAGRGSAATTAFDAWPDESAWGPLAPSVEEARACGRLILVAEDDSVNRKVIRQQLSLLGHAAEIADDGLQALAFWRRGGHALLLTDLHMPSMDGYTLAARIRAEERGPRLPILAITANALHGEAARARAAGVDEYLTKPIQLRLLGAAIERWLPPLARPAGADDGAAAHPGLQAVAARLEPAAAPSPPALLDLEVLAGLVGGDDETLREFLADFRASAATTAAELRQAAQRGDAERLAAGAHRLKSSARSIGAGVLGEACAALEAAARGAETAAIEAACAAFERALAALQVRLDAHLERAAAPAGSS